MMPKSALLFFVVLSVAYVSCKPHRYGHGEVIEEEEFIREIDGPFGEEIEIDFIERDDRYRRSNAQKLNAPLLKRSTTKYDNFEGTEVVGDYNSGYNEGYYENHQSSSVKPANYEPEEHYDGHHSSSVKPTPYEPEEHYDGHHSGSVKPTPYEPEEHYPHGQTEDSSHLSIEAVREKIGDIYKEASHRIYNLLSKEYQAVKGHANYIQDAFHNASERVLELIRGEHDEHEHEHEHEHS